VKIATSSQLAAPAAVVFAALTDPAILQRAIPGCESLVATGEDDYAATLKVGVAGLKGTYTGSAEIRDKQPPESLRLSFAGKGGPGFVRGSAVVQLAAEGAGTHVACDVDVQVGGLIAAVGSRLVEAAARKLADDFFANLAREIAARS
jgi:hypothetical protein